MGRLEGAARLFAGFFLMAIATVLYFYFTADLAVIALIHLGVEGHGGQALPPLLWREGVMACFLYVSAVILVRGVRPEASGQV